MCGCGVGAEGGIGTGGEVFCSMQFLALIDHSVRRCPTDATRPYSGRESMQQSADMLGNRLVSLKQLTSYGDPGITTILRASLVIGNFYDFCPFLAFDS